ncbi:EAL domain-containing protein [Devosia sp.]|uniref:putative bifunctional diguanylate cyclase/phosphodiesterase n=1 Tax=Devosia sp. TaxID=1871048 RepID=UPI0025FB5B58|nr:EAL domain-containing protein [Devosia sp.]MCR6634017.1 EAL domain-containing protein [Devosia sp.]
MSVFRRLGRVIFESPGSAELSLAQWHALKRQVPLMYAMLLANMIILAATHFSGAPRFLTLLIPAALTVLCGSRILRWVRSDSATITPDQARRDIRAMVVLGPLIAVGISGWALSLYPYGGPLQQAHIAFFMAITTIGCMFCLLNVRLAAVAITACVLIPFTAFFALTGQPVFVAIALNMVLVTAILATILIDNYRGFTGLVASRQEMARRQEQTQQLLDENHRLAWLDSLTGVPNRRSFQKELARALEDAKANGKTIAVARLNLDRFKAVNEVFGQIMGDRVLIEVAQRIDITRPFSSFLARLDSDNFAVILTENSSGANLERLGQRLCEAIARPVKLPLGTAHVTASIGFAASGPEDTPETLFDHADYAGWLAKRDARGGTMVFSAIDAHDLRQIRRMEHLLHTADLDEEIYVLLQPQFDIAIGETTGFEVLARWRSPILGEVSPAEFIPMAERMGQIGKITQIVLRKALAISEQLPRRMRLSVNLSANDIGSPAAIDAVIAQVEAAPRPSRVDFEITETAIMRDLDQAKEALSRLLSLGARIALDDFGTGHSSLTHVQRLPLHRIKIDRSFVAEVTSDPTSRAIVKTMVDLCRNLGMSCVFEGIETEAQLEALAGLGGTVMQGYLFGRPMLPEQALAHAEKSDAGWRPEHNQRFGAAS